MGVVFANPVFEKDHDVNGARGTAGLKWTALILLFCAAATSEPPGDGTVATEIDARADRGFAAGSPPDDTGRNP